MPGQIFLQEHQRRHGEEGLAGQEQGVAAVAQKEGRRDDDGAEQSGCQGGAEDLAQLPAAMEAEEDQFACQDSPEEGCRPGQDDEEDHDQGCQ